MERRSAVERNSYFFLLPGLHAGHIEHSSVTPTAIEGERTTPGELGIGSCTSGPIVCTPADRTG